MRARIVCLPGDGIGPEVLQEAVRVLTSVACAFGHSFTFVEEKLGKSAVSAHGTPLPGKTLDSCRGADAVLLGASCTATWIESDNRQAPGHGLALLQEGLGLYAGLMLSAIPPLPPEVSPLKDAAAGLDMALAWPLASPEEYSPQEGEPQPNGGDAPDTLPDDTNKAEQAARMAFGLSRQRRKRITVAFHPDLPAGTRLFLEAAQKAAREFPDVAARWLEADRCAAELVSHPSRFDVLLAGPSLHQPLSGIVSGLFGGFGLASMMMTGDQKPALFMPAQGEEPSQAGRDTANPIGMILCAAMMLKKALRLASEADCVEMAVRNVLDSGWRTADMVSGNAPRVGTEAIGKLIAEQVDTAGAVMGAFRR